MQPQNFRKNLRLQGYDYSQPGFYFVTVCTKDMECIFGEIRDFRVELSPVGVIVERCWRSLPDWFSNLAIDDFVLMPNHIHGIVQVIDDPKPLRNIVGAFKSAASRNVNVELGARVIWQRGYYDRIVRSEKMLSGFREYIVGNPVKWQLDKLNPLAMPDGSHGIVPPS